MASDHELQIVAAAVGILREDWPTRSVLAVLRREPSLRDRPYRWLVVAAVVAALDPDTKTPKRLTEFGPWWQAAAVSTGEATQTPGPGPEPACERVGHEHELARNCRACAAERLAETEADTAPAQAAPPPEAITAVANRHRTRNPPARTGRDFAQTTPLPSPDIGVQRCHCGAFFLPYDDGRDAHETVFGHQPSPPAETELAAVP
jgi:hypothetical protein